MQSICERGLLGRPPPSTRQYTRPPFPIWSSALQTSNCRPHHTCPSSPRSALQDTHVHAKVQQVPGRKPEAFPLLSVRTSLPSSSSSLTCRRSISTLQTCMLICVSHKYFSEPFCLSLLQDQRFHIYSLMFGREHTTFAWETFHVVRDCGSGDY